MAGLGSFIRLNAPWLAAGGLLTFGSSFGQTYFISLFAGEIRAAFSLSHGEWGGIYALGTLASATLMLFFGGVVDSYRTRALAALTLILFAGFCVAMAVLPVVALLPVVIFGLRFCGQGMMSHLAIVSTGRWFAAQRGRAVSIVSVGYSLGEAVMPYSFVLLMGLIGWRMAWGVAACILLVYVPLIMLILRRERSPRSVVEADRGAGMLGRHWTRGQALRHWLFWACVPGLLAQPVFGTAFFFQQVHLVEMKGWTLEGFAALFPAYTISSVVALFCGGALVDRFGVARIMPFYLLPMSIAFALVSSSTSLNAALVAMILIGVMQGLGASVAGAFWPEYYGTRHLGAIRSVASSLMVFATAIGPLGTGYMIDQGIDYNYQLRGMAGVGLVTSAIYFAALGRARRLLAPAA